MNRAGLAASAVPASQSSIPDANLPAIWRNGFGAAVEAIDRARRQLRPSIKRSRTAKAYDEALDAALQYAFDCTRSPFHIVDYPTANEACRSLQRMLDPWLAAQGMAVATADETGTGSAVGNSPVRQDAPNPDQSNHCGGSVG